MGETDMAELDKLLRHNKIETCTECGGRMRAVRSGVYECETCGAQALDDFGRIREYMKDHGSATKEELVVVLGVRAEVVNEYIRQQRLEEAGNAGDGKCLLCGAPIKFGSICAKCKRTSRSGTTVGKPAGASGKRRYM